MSVEYCLHLGDVVIAWRTWMNFTISYNAECLFSELLEYNG